MGNYNDFRVANNELKAPKTISEFVNFLKSSIDIIKHADVIPNIDEGPVLFVGDIHGFYDNFIYALEIAEKKGAKNIVFLGDYVDRGNNQIECLVNILYLYTMSIKKLKKIDIDFNRPWFIDPRIPEDPKYNVIMLRGNHEDMEINERYGFFDALLERYGSDQNLKNEIIELYYHLPLIATTKWKTIGLHGGVPQIDNEVSYKEVIKFLRGKKLPIRTIFDYYGMEEKSEELDINALVFQFLWNDPYEHGPENEPFTPSFRGNGIYFFSEAGLDRFLNETGYKRLIRAHESSRGAYQVLWGGKLVHIFSAYPYFGQADTYAYYLEYDDGTGQILNEEGRILKGVDAP
ncbi:MAG: metallophosphoesterase [Promethearchaeota archaeon]